MGTQAQEVEAARPGVEETVGWAAIPATRDARWPAEAGFQGADAGVARNVTESSSISREQALVETVGAKAGKSAETGFLEPVRPATSRFSWAKTR